MVVGLCSILESLCEFRRKYYYRMCFYGNKGVLTAAVIVCLFASSSGGSDIPDRESRKLFGGYRITPSYCKANRASRNNHGPTICMFNHECVQRKGEVVGACMDGFLFGACCALKETSELHIPKGPGIVVTGDPFGEGELDDSDRIAEWHQSFRPQVKPASVKVTSETQATSTHRSTSTEIINEGVSQITNTLLSTPPKENTVIFIKPPFNKTDLYSFSTISHDAADTVVYNKNGSTVDNVVRPSDLNIQVSSMQTKPTSVPPKTVKSTTPRAVSTHKPIYERPQFKPKPHTKKPVTTSAAPDKYVLVQTITNTPLKTEESSYNNTNSINSIIQMLNTTAKPIKTVANVTSVKNITVSTKKTTAKPQFYITGPPQTTTRTPFVSTTHPSATGYISTLIPHRTSTVYTNYFQSQKPESNHISEIPVPSLNTYSSTHLSTSSEHSPTSTTQKPARVTTKKPPSTSYSPTLIPHRTSTVYTNYFESQKPESNHISEKPNPNSDTYSSTHLSTSSDHSPTSSTHRPASVTTRKPPSTSYVYSSKPSKRPPVTQNPIGPSYDVAPDSFASVTPTVIVLNSVPNENNKPLKGDINIPNGDISSSESYKKPVNQVTINNVISSTNNIHLGNQKPAKPTSTVVITPKPTNPPDIKRPVTTVSYGSQDYSSSTYVPVRSPTTLRPEFQTSPDDMINFPPVRNPNLNASGSNPSLYNTTISSDEYNALPEVEFTTPAFLQEDEALNEKMHLFVNKIVGSLQGTFQELHDIVILDKKVNITSARPPTTVKPVKKTPATTRRPVTTTRKPPARITTAKTTTRKPVRSPTTTRRPTVVTQAATTKKPASTTKKPRPTKKVTTTTQPPTTTASPSIATSSSELQSQQSDEVTTDAADAYQDGSIDYNDPKLCGVRPLVKAGRIVGGKNAAFGEWPWQVLVRESTWLGLFTKNKCGGVLITSRFVTTAAHCQPGFLASLVAVFGEHDISGDLERKRPQSRNVRRVVVHRKYDAATFENDLAILELESPIHFDAHIVPICMPPDDADYTGRMATVTGWGRLKYGGGVPAVLQEVQVPIIENSVCQEMFQTAGHNKVILNSFLCAGYANGQKDSCEGDSGGPLTLQRPDGRWQLVGTVSHGIKCASPYLPGVYMRTAYYKPWLRSVIAGLH